MIRYRIVRDNYRGFEAQFKRNWLTPWRQCFGCNTHNTLREAQLCCDLHAHGEYTPKPLPQPYTPPLAPPSAND